MRNEFEKLPKELLHKYEVPALSSDLEERLFRQLAKEGLTPKRNVFRPLAWLVAAALVVLAVALGPRLWTKPTTLKGSLQATQRTTLSLGEYGVVVVEEGAQLSWLTTKSGLRVTQSSGSTFYRVEPTQKNFIVTTPAGDLSVLGTCFQVEVKTMTSAQQLALGGVLGAAAATVLLTVYEGSVTLSNERGSLTVHAGEKGEVVSGRAPTLATNTEQTLAASKPENPLEKENEALKKQVAELREDVKALKEAAKEQMDPTLQFSTEERDEAWASQVENLLEERIERYFKLPKDSYELECHQSCCQVVFHGSPKADNDAIWGDAMRDIQSSIGFYGMHFGASFGPAPQNEDWSSSTFCFKTPSEATKAPSPDRGAEREALLAAAAPALELCAKELTVPLRVEINLFLDKEGQISGVQSRSDPLGNPTAVCVEKAILAAANFAPSPLPGDVPLTIRLQPTPK